MVKAKKRRVKHRALDKVKQIKTPKGYIPKSAYRSVKKGYTAVYFEKGR